MKSISKFLALVLRHNPQAGNLTLDAEGWADVDAVMKAIQNRFGGFTRDQLRELVDTNDKKRYAFNEDGTKIRASQGHSIEVDLKLDATKPPPFLYHGTKTAFLDAIMREGLTPQSRQHVHLSKDTATAKIVANRRSGKSVILRVNTTRMEGDFFVSDNGVWLTDHVPATALDILGEDHGA
jgi:putative RNA 2'-phosphotransferase